MFLQPVGLRIDWSQDPLIHQLPIEDITNLQLIGTGAFGFVFQCQIEQADYAIKIVFPDTRDTTSEMFNKHIKEAEIAISLGNPYIVKTHTYNDRMTYNQRGLADLLRGADYQNLQSRFSDNTDEPIPAIFIKMDLCGPTLQEWLDDDRSEQKQGDALTFMQVRIVDGLIAAVKHLHRKRLCHRDINPSNICFSRTGPGGDKYRLPIKLTDFGLCSEVNNMQRTQTGRGTQFYTPPEISEFGEFEFGKFDLRADLYSLGYVFWEILQNFSESEKEVNFMNFRETRYALLIRNHSILNNSRNVILGLICENYLERTESIELVAFERSVNASVWTVHNGSELEACLQFRCQDGDTIQLGECIFEGVFEIAKNKIKVIGKKNSSGDNVSIIEGSTSKIKITGNLCNISGLTFKKGDFGMLEIDLASHGNRFHDLNFEDSFNGILCYGNGNKFYNIRLNNIKNFGLVLCGEGNECNKIFMIDIAKGVIIRNSMNKFKNISYKRVYDEHKCLVALDFVRGKTSHIERLSCLGLKIGDHGIILGKRTNSITLKNSKFYSMKVAGLNHAIKNCDGIISGDC